MCGVSGLLDFRQGQRTEEIISTVERMTETLRHRGPDGSGRWVDAPAGIALGHRRLAVIDLSAHGRQPMVSVDGRYVLSYNGEIYNFRELRRDLESVGHRFVGHSDTEVVLAAIARWGLQRALRCFNGMFALALWDRRDRRLHLARDRLGEKPMYYGWAGSTFIFGSELKALRAHPAFPARIDRHAVALYVQHSCVPGPHCIYEDASKLPPGTTLTVSLSGGAGCTPAPVPYWSALTAAEAGIAASADRSPPELVEELEALLLDAVRLRMEADVPLGAFLSGGIDSSLVVAMMQAQTAKPVKTFTIGVGDGDYDESVPAQRVAVHLGTQHTALRATPEDCLKVVPRLPSVYDEPFADSSQIPTMLVSELARREVTVSLSGDGGDELFGGYNRYTWCGPVWERIEGLPLHLRRAAAAALLAVPTASWDSLYRRVRPALPRWLRVRTPGAKIQRLAEVLPASDMDDMYARLQSTWQRADAVVLGAAAGGPLGKDPAGWPSFSDPLQRMMYADTVGYLPDDILTKVDRATMDVSLEARIPLLDHRVVELAWKIPMCMKIRSGQGKWVLRTLLRRYLPADLVDRPKMGFSMPMGAWLRGPLREWAEGLIDGRRLRQDEVFNESTVRRAWHTHLSGRCDLHYRLWSVLMFQAWLEAHAAPAGACPIDGPRVASAFRGR